jgi:hypothetical protein
MIDNPYLALCPCCGEMICLKCVEIDERLGELCGCDECNARWLRQYYGVTTISRLSDAQAQEALARLQGGAPMR